MINLFKKYPEKRVRQLIFCSIWVACLFGSWSVFPYIYYLGILPAGISLLKVFVFNSLQSLVLFGLAVYLSYIILPKTDLHPFIVKDPVKRIVYPGIISGVLIGLIIFTFEKFIFFSSAISVLHPPFWAGLLASVYGAINEEVLLRLFLFTFIYFLFGKLFKNYKNNRLTFLWITNIIVALIFGLGHLPAALQIAPGNFFEVFRILFLNGIAGIVFGYLYFSRGLFAAMVSHFACDLILHVFLI